MATVTKCAPSVPQKKTNLYIEEDRNGPRAVCQCFKILCAFHENQTIVSTIPQKSNVPDTGGLSGAIAVSQKKTSIYNDVDRGGPIMVCQCFRILCCFYENQTSVMLIPRYPIAPDTGGLSCAIIKMIIIIIK